MRRDYPEWREVTVFLDLDGTWGEVKEGLDKAFNSVPEEYRDNAVVEVSSEGNGAWITYRRRETDEERNVRAAHERRAAQVKVSNERMLYEELKRKFEGS